MRITDFILKHYDKRNLFCPSCQAAFDREGCEIVGIKEVGSNSSLFMEYVCPQCDDRSGFTLNKMTMEDLASAILEDLVNEEGEDKEIEEGITERRERAKNKKQGDKKAKKRFSSKSKITLEEQASAKEMLENSHTWHDWLVQIGASEEVPEK
jgi:hypothetical protein